MNYTKDQITTGVRFAIDKPLHWTSFDVVNAVRKKIHTKIGHAGTLDPLATGLLICCTGQMTKAITNYQDQEKEYTGTIQLGATTPTYDLESQPEDFKSYQGITQSDLENVKPQFMGDIWQVPPIHSAIKKGGVPAYKMARAGESVTLGARLITISELEIDLTQDGMVSFRTVCSKGTYIRSLAHDIGRALGVGGYLKSLRRTRIGSVHVDNAVQLPELLDYLDELGFERKKKPKNENYGRHSSNNNPATT